MPGPLSTPMGWTEKEHMNHLKNPGTGEFPKRKSGKTMWDHHSGKWANQRAKKAERMVNSK